MRAIVLGVFIALLLSGCTGGRPPTATTVEIGLITPGVWTVDNSTDYMVVWMHNTYAGSVKVGFDVTMRDGSALPSDWSLKSSRGQVTLQPVGSKSRTGTVSYTDWAWSLLNLTVPAGTPPGDHALRINSGLGTHDFNLRINNTATRVAKPGDSVVVAYEGRFNDTNEQFDKSDLEVRLGAGDTVVGYDYGLMGLALNETATLVVPPALAYGYDQTDPSRTQFNGRTLRFAVSIIEFK